MLGWEEGRHLYTKWCVGEARKGKFQFQSCAFQKVRKKEGITTNTDDYFFSNWSQAEVLHLHTFIDYTSHSKR